MSIEADRQAIIELPFDGKMLASLRETARLVATHYSTQIEGNRLTQAQVQEVLSGARFPERERDETEVRNYYRALEEVERLAQLPGPIAAFRGAVGTAASIPRCSIDQEKPALSFPSKNKPTVAKLAYHFAKLMPTLVVRL